MEHVTRVKSGSDRGYGHEGWVAAADGERAGVDVGSS